MRFQLWLHKLKDIRIKGFPRRRRSAASLCNGSPRSSPRSPYLRCGSPRRPAETVSKRRFAEPGFCLSPVNHKCFDIPFPASPIHNGLLNSPVAPAMSPIASKARAANAIGTPETSVSVRCGCRAPLASFRKAKENLQAISASIRSEDYERESKRREGPAEVLKSFSSSFREVWEKTGAWSVLAKIDNEFVRKKVVLRRIGSKKRQAPLETAAGEATNMDSLKKMGSSKDEQAAKERPESSMKDAEGQISRVCSFRLSTSTGDVALDTCPQAWDKEYSSFTSDDNLFTSFEHGRQSHSSNSSSEFYERNLIMSFDGVLKEARDAGRSLFDDCQLRSGIGSSQSREDSKAQLERAECCPRKRDVRVLNPSPEDGLLGKYIQEEQSKRGNFHCEAEELGSYEVGLDIDQGVFYPWLCNEATNVDLEANAKAWAQCLLPDTSSSQQKDGLETERAKLQRVVGLDEAREAWNQSEGSSRRHSRSSRRRSTTATRRRSSQSQQGFSGQSTSSNEDDSSSSEETVRSNRSSSNRSTRKEKKVARARRKKKMEAEENSQLKALPSNVHGKVCDSVAVVKCTEDPYLDFKNSMVDMILEKELYRASDLEELLQCFLSLNSLEHHDTIVQAFTEVWEKVFGSNVRSPLLS